MTETLQSVPHAAGDPVLAGAGLHAVFQPIVDLATGGLVAHEALIRGPESHPRPDQLFAAARAAGRLVEFDRTCRRIALGQVVAAGPAGPSAVFLNVEPGGMPARNAPPEARRFMAAGGTLVLEFTERALTLDPARVLAFAARVRAQGIAIALDDVGSHPDSLALMPFLRPEIVKLDMRLVQRPLDDEAAAVIASAGAYAARDGATLLAEGIETEEHLARARALGATLGQGYYFGRPGPLVADARPRTGAGEMFASRPPRGLDYRSPLEIVSRATPLRRGGSAEVLHAAEFVERRALTAEGPIVLLGSTLNDLLPPGEHAQRWVAASRRAPLAVLLGAGTEPLPGVRGTALDPADPLRQELTVVAVGPHVAKALVARLVDEQTLDYTLVYDRGLVLEVAHALMNRIVPTAESSVAA